MSSTNKGSFTSGSKSTTTSTVSRIGGKSQGINSDSTIFKFYSWISIIVTVILTVYIVYVIFYLSYILSVVDDSNAKITGFYKPAIALPLFFAVFGLLILGNNVVHWYMHRNNKGAYTRTGGVSSRTYHRLATGGMFAYFDALLIWIIYSMNQDQIQSNTDKFDEGSFGSVSTFMTVTYIVLTLTIIMSFFMVIEFVQGMRTKEIKKEEKPEPPAAAATAAVAAVAVAPSCSKTYVFNNQ